ncbi:MAG TPA: hypothetical protein VJS45_14965 [Acidimicrobiia bacterium]|nr:hypothetical protein [Acidimicrobiia bacterium]
MPAGPRIRTDNVYGTLSSALGGAAGDVTMNSAGLANLAAVSSAHAVIVIDPLRTAGPPEIVVVTAHTGGATAATITRGAYGTTRRSHAIGTLWVHAPTREDFIQILTSSTRPSDPYEGQLIYETDTDAYKAHNGTAWEQALTLGAWATWVPTLTQSGAVTKTVTSARYTKVGRTVTGVASLTVTGTGTANNAILVGLPVAAAGTNLRIGSGAILDASDSFRSYGAIVEILTTTTVRFWPTSTDAVDVLGNTVFTAALANNDQIHMSIAYEAAA